MSRTISLVRVHEVSAWCWEDVTQYLLETSPLLMLELEAQSRIVQISKMALTMKSENCPLGQGTNPA